MLRSFKPVYVDHNPEHDPTYLSGLAMIIDVFSTTLSQISYCSSLFLKEYLLLSPYLIENQTLGCQ